MAAIWLTAQAEWRRRWRSLLVLALLAGFAGGVTLAAFTGSRRADTSFDRLLERQKYPNVSVRLDERPDPDLVREAAKLPGVEVAAHRAMLVVAPADTGLVAGRDTIAAAMPVVAGGDPGLFGIVEGRPYDERRADELVVNETMRDELDAEIGDRLSLVSLTPAQGAAIEESGGRYPSPAGPTTEVTLVGVARGPEDVSDAPEPILIVTPAFYDRYGAEIAHADGVDLRVDEDHLAGIEDHLRPLFGHDAAIGPADDIGASIEDGLAVDVNGLRVFAAAAAVAGLLALGQALVRQAEAMSVQHPTCRALGMTSRQLIAAGVTAVVPVAAGGALLAAAIAVAGGPLAITGLARQAEPDPGAWLDSAIPYGAVLVGLVVLALAAGAFALAGTRGHEGARSAAPRAPRRTDALAALPAPVGLGVRMALDRGRGPGALPSIPALLGAAVGVAGVVAALAVGARIDDLLATPKLWGANYDATVVTGVGPTLQDTTAERLAGLRDMDAVAVFESLDVPVYAGDRRDMVGTTTVRPHRGTIPPVIPEGRAPGGPDEVALGDGVLDRLDVEVGGTVEVERSGKRDVLRVVGTFLEPGVDDASSGMLVTPQGLEGLDGEDEDSGVLVRFAPNVDQDAALDRLRAFGERVDVMPAGEQVPSNVDNLDELGALPWVLAVFLALLAAIAAVHVLMSTTRRRRHDLAVLRVLGFIAGQVRSTLRWQALTVAGVGLLAGVPAGVFAGRRIWSALADSVGVVDDWTFPWLTVAVVVPAALGVAVLLAIAPGRAAARLSPGRVLRAE
jgi:ABC-type lipoprotein release transport system permease subunit